jgi:hypothetical protein
LAILLDGLWSQLGSTSFFSAFAPIVLGGGVSILKFWIPDEEKVRNRISLKNEALRDRVNRLLNDLIQKGLSANNLRGKPPQEPDFVNDYTKEVFRVLDVTQQMALIQKRIKASITYLFYTIVVGIASVLLVVLYRDAQPYVAIVEYATIGTQICTVFFIRQQEKRLETCERST